MKSIELEMIRKVQWKKRGFKMRTSVGGKKRRKEEYTSKERKREREREKERERERRGRGETDCEIERVRRE